MNYDKLFLIIKKSVQCTNSLAYINSWFYFFYFSIYWEKCINDEIRLWTISFILKSLFCRRRNNQDQTLAYIVNNDFSLSFIVQTSLEGLACFSLLIILQAFEMSGSKNNENNNKTKQENMSNNIRIKKYLRNIVDL